MYIKRFISQKIKSFQQIYINKCLFYVFRNDIFAFIKFVTSEELKQITTNAHIERIDFKDIKLNVDLDNQKPDSNSLFQYMKV